MIYPSSLITTVLGKKPTPIKHILSYSSVTIFSCHDFFKVLQIYKLCSIVEQTDATYIITSWKSVYPRKKWSEKKIMKMDGLV